MKTRKIRISLIVVLMFLCISTISYAQRGRYQNDRRGDRPYRGYANFNFSDQLDLSDDQKEKIDEIKLASSKEFTQTQNKINELEAQLTTTLSQDEVDQNKVNKLVDEIGNLKTTVRKQRLNNHLKIRNLLTEKQKLLFDQHTSRRGSGRGFYGPCRM